MSIKKHAIYSPELFNIIKKSEKNGKNKKILNIFLIAESLCFKGFAAFYSGSKTKK